MPDIQAGAAAFAVSTHLGVVEIDRSIDGALKTEGFCADAKTPGDRIAGRGQSSLLHVDYDRV